MIIYFNVSSTFSMPFNEIREAEEASNIDVPFGMFKQSISFSPNSNVIILFGEVAGNAIIIFFKNMHYNKIYSILL